MLSCHAYILSCLYSWLLCLFCICLYVCYHYVVNKRNEDAFHILSSDANRNEAFEFLPHNCRLARLQARPVPSRDVCLSVYVTFVYCVETSQLPSQSRQPIHQTLWQYSDVDPLTGTKIVIFDHYLALGLMTGGVSSVFNKFRPWSLLITASVDFVYINGPVYAEENRTEFICKLTHW